MVAWPDLRARARRFVVIGFGMALVLSITLLLSAFSEGFNLRADRLLDSFGADHYVVPTGSAGGLTAQTLFPSAIIDQVEGADRVVPVSLVRTGVSLGDETAGVVIVGMASADGGPAITEGRAIAAPREIVADTEVPIIEIGDDVVLGGQTFTLVGRTEGVSWDLATAGIFMQSDDLQEVFRSGGDLITAVATVGRPTSIPDGFEIQTRQDAFDDLLVRSEGAKRSIDSFRTTLWVLAVVIVGSILYLAAQERIRDFAIFKATGATNLDLVLGLVVQAMIVGLVAGAFAIGLAHLLMPIYPGLLSLPITIAWPVLPVAIVIATIGSFVGIRRAISVDPSQAFG